MAFSVVRIAALACAALFVAASPAALAQSQDNSDSKAAEAKAAGQRKIDEIAQATHAMTGPAANPECYWHGTRIVGLLWNDDIDTALRQLQIYDRFNCPSAHVQAAYRCFLRQGPPDPKAPNPIMKLAEECWINPGSPPVAPATAATIPPTPARPATNNR
jgi:hypothetical protein